MRVAKQQPWMERAACTGKSELFHNEKSRIISRRAKEICASCAVQKDCLDYALENEHIGIWGGLTGNERRRLRRRSRQTH